MELIKRAFESIEKHKRLAKEHICICAYPMDTDNNVVKVGWGGWVEGDKGEEGERHL